MKTIKKLVVKSTYRVELENVEVSDEAYNGLKEAYYYKGGDVCDDDYTEGWLLDNISETDATDWEFEIDDLEEED